MTEFSDTAMALHANIWAWGSHTAMRAPSSLCTTVLNASPPPLSRDHCFDRRHSFHCDTGRHGYVANRPTPLAKSSAESFRYTRRQIFANSRPKPSRG